MALKILVINDFIIHARYSLDKEVISIGSSPDCDVVVILPWIEPHHATITLPANGTAVVKDTGTAAVITHNSIKKLSFSIKSNDEFLIGPTRFIVEHPVLNPNPNTSQQGSTPRCIPASPGGMPIETNLAGVTHTNTDGTSRQSLLAELRGNTDGQKPTILKIRRDPTNKFDPNAIAVLDPADRQLGFIPRDIAEKLAPRIDSGTRISAQVLEFTGGSNGYNHGLRISVSEEGTGSALLAMPSPGDNNSRISNHKPTGCSSMGGFSDSSHFDYFVRRSTPTGDDVPDD